MGDLPGLPRQIKVLTEHISHGSFYLEVQVRSLPVLCLGFDCGLLGLGRILKDDGNDDFGLSAISISSKSTANHMHV